MMTLRKLVMANDLGKNKFGRPSEIVALEAF